MTANRSAGWLSFAQVMAHCGGSPRDAVHFVTGAIASAPEDPQPYAVLADLWKQQRTDLATFFQSGNTFQAVLAQSYISFLENDMDAAVMTLGGIVGARPTVAWANAPWFGDSRFVQAVSADALAEAVMRTMDYGRELDTPEVREALRPWIDIIDVVCARESLPEAMAKMAIFLRACGLIDASFALCDRADAIEPVMFTEVVRAGTWRRAGDVEQTMAAFQRALALDPANWSLFLDMADLSAEHGDFARAVQFVEQGLLHEPTEAVLRAAAAGYRARLTGSAGDLRELIALWPHLPNDSYRSLLMEHACAGPGLPAELVTEARNLPDR